MQLSDAGQWTLLGLVANVDSHRRAPVCDVKSTTDGRKLMAQTKQRATAL